MRLVNTFDPSTLPVAQTNAPTAGTGTSQNSGLQNQCGAIYFMNKSNTGIHLVFEDGSHTVLPAWFARVYKLGNKSNQLWMSQAYQLASVANPISSLYWEAYQQGEDITGLYNGPIPYANAGNLVASQVINTNNAPGSPVVLGTPSALPTELELNNDGSGFVGGGHINFNAAGKEFFTYNTDLSHPYTFLELDDNAAIPHIWQVQVDSGTGRPIRFIDATNGQTVLQMNAMVSMGQGANLGFDQNQASTDGGGNFSAVSYKTIAGKQETGFCGVDQNAAAGGVTGGDAVNYKTVMTNLPSSLTFVTQTHANDASTGTSTITKFGFAFTVTATAAGRYFNYAHYTTVGN